MTSHPNRSMTYWQLFPRNFGNEYTIGIATSKADAEQYEAEEYQRIDRDFALRQMSRRAASHEQLFISVLVDGEQVEDRFQTARTIRTGRGL